ncbi:hypothetical protein GE09DRAFT_1134892 [Coniochaeta sp. 2T2.1]|nr:hypothetical protein GE09DRAFT_1134892 [Coniochaeta sp. 2T2.1]
MLSWRTHAISGTIGGSSLARAKPALALLYLSRRFASSEAVEPVKSVTIPLHGAPYRFRGRWLPAWRLKRRAYPRVSPSAVILERLYTRGTRMTREQWAAFQDLAKNRSTRLPIMTAQMLMRQEEDQMPTSLSEQLSDEVDPYDETSWNNRIKMLAYTGITEDHLRHWVWILRADTADARVTRFLSEDTHKPLFLLFIMTAQQHSILDRELFMSLLDYVDKTHCQPRSRAPAQRPGQRALNTDLNFTPIHFGLLLQRLIAQAARLCPEALLKIAEITTSYLKSMRVSPKSYDGGFSDRCYIFNRALILLTETALLRPFANIEYNWEAQKHLLAFSTSLRRPYAINAAGYRAIQSVMAAREKSEAEEKVAIRSAKSWPPYREAWDGVDEQRHPDDDLSRTVKTGILAREAGYPENEIDRALSAAGGAILDEGPTVQTRLLPLSRPRSGTNAAENVYYAWAVRVKASRNAQEAWATFRRVPSQYLQPSALIYAEMFAKLFARQVGDPATAVPGNTKEVMPVYHPGNLSEFEKWRLQPPTVDELYDHMIRSGVRPIPEVLTLLIQNANTEEEVVRYLRDSPYKDFTHVVADKDQACPPTNETFFEVARIYKLPPLNVFNAYIAFLCKMQKRAYSAALDRNVHSSTEPAMDNSYLQRAMAVVAVRLRPESWEGRSYKPPWYHILRTVVLARTHGALVNVARRQFALFLDVFKWVRTIAGMDAVLLEIVCLSVGRVMAANFTHPSYAPAGERWWTRANHVGGEGDRQVLGRAWVDVMAAFEEMKKPGSGVGGFHVYVYLRVLGMYGALDEMVVVMRWVLARLEERQGLRSMGEEGTLGHAYLLRAFGFAEAYMNACGKEEQAAAIRTRRRTLVEEEGYPLKLAETDTDLEDVAMVRDIAEGWREVSS